MSLDPLFRPRGVAIIGSAAPGKLGYELGRQVIEGGFRQVYSVNPKAQGIEGLGDGSAYVRGFVTVAEIPHPVDLAVIVSPPPTVPDVLRDCGAAGVKAAVIITAGFGEVGNHAGEEEVARVAREQGIRFIGPNCAGMVNTAHHLYPTLETRPPAGRVSLLAQSGALGGIILAMAKQQGLGIAKFVSYGNRADIDEMEMLRYLAADPETDVVALYIESVRDGREFLDTIHACNLHKPVVVIKAGRSQSGQRATLSHTGSMAGSDAVYDAALRQAGALRVRTAEELFDVCKGFSTVGRLRGNRVAIVTNSGGPAVLAADWAEDVGLNVCEPDADARQRLSEFLPPQCALKNPIDLTVEGNEEGYRKTLDVLGGGYDAMIAMNIAPPYLNSVSLARGICAASGAGRTPVVATFQPAAVVEDAVEYLESHAVPCFTSGERAAGALAQMARHAALMPHASSLPEEDEPRGVLPGDPDSTALLEPEAMAWLSENGVETPAFRTASRIEDVIPACRELLYPVVMKVVSPDILHKSDHGGVELNITNDKDAVAAFERIRRAAGDVDFRGVVIYRMVKKAQEVLVGLTRDPQFGPVLAFGLGGIYTEIWRDIVLRVAPITRQDAERMIGEIKAIALLRGARGAAPCDLEALAHFLAAVSQLPFSYPDIAELDLNPVFVLEHGLSIGDARVIRHRLQNPQRNA